MKHFLATLLLSACAAFGEPVDLGKVADRVALYRADVTFLAPLASPELQARLVELEVAMLQVETALRAGGVVDDVTSAAKAALAVAAVIAAQLPPENDLRFAIGLAQVLLNHLAAGEFE